MSLRKSAPSPTRIPALSHPTCIWPIPRIHHYTQVSAGDSSLEQVRKQTYATGELDIHVLLPLITNPPSTSVAVVSILPGSEPWLGSVNPYVVHVSITAGIKGGDARRHR